MDQFNLLICCLIKFLVKFIFITAHFIFVCSTIYLKNIFFSPFHFKIHAANFFLSVCYVFVLFTSLCTFPPTCALKGQLCRVVKERKALEQKMENKECWQRCKIPASGTTSLLITNTHAHTQGLVVFNVCTF